MTAPSNFQWWPVDGGRHAIPGDLRAGQTGETLCHVPARRGPDEPTKAQWLWPTCQTCYELARSCRHVALEPGYDRRHR